MNAIKLLEAQHREMEKAFSRIERASSAPAKKKLLELIADSLAVHATIEEHQFYPAVKARRTAGLLPEWLGEHDGIKRVIADLLDVGLDDETFDAKIKVLKEQVEQHVVEEESVLFPKSRKILDADELETLGRNMQAEQARLENKGDARLAVSAEIFEAAPLT